MPVFEGYGKRVLFIHVPKTGGAALEHSLREAGLKQSYHSLQKTAYGCTPQHLTADNLVQEFTGQQFDLVFTIVRDPVPRMLSERRHRADLRDGQLPAFDRWVNIMINRAQRNPSLHDNHMRPQTDFLLPGVRILRYEWGLNDCLRQVAELAEITELAGRSVPRVNVRRSDHAPELSELRARTKARFLGYYARDYSVLDYAPPSELTGVLPVCGAKTCTGPA